MGNRIVHFEIPVNDTEKMSKFYGDLFGWKFDKQPMPGMDYWLIETTGKGQTDLGGGMYAKQGETDRPRFYVNVDNIDSHTEMFKQAGGVVVIQKQEIPGMGWSVMGNDPEGNLIGLFQPAQPPRPASTSSEKKDSHIKRSHHPIASRVAAHRAKKSSKSKKSRR